MTEYVRTAATVPAPDELVVVALYHADGRFWSHTLAYWRDGEWLDDTGEYSWPGSTGLLWTYFETAPAHAEDIPGHKLAMSLRHQGSVPA